MKLAEALGILQEPAAEDAASFNVFLACGCTPLHLQTFLDAHLRKSRPGRAVAVDVGLYRNLLGNLERLRITQPHAGAVVLEWPDLDPRLGLRQLGGWSPKDLPDILDTVRRQADQIEAAILRISQQAPVAVSLPTLPFPPVSYAAGR